MAIGGDITRYMSYANDIRLGGRPLYLLDRPLFLVFPLVAQILTGLHIFYAYSGMQFYLLILPTSFYILLKAVFRENQKIPAVGAVLASITSGLGFMGIWDFFSKYTSDMSGTHSALLSTWNKSSLSFISYQFYVMPLSYSLLFIALSFMYRYLFPTNHRRFFSDLLLCGLFAAQLPFIHSIFEFSFFIICLVICFIFLAPIGKSSMVAFLKVLVVIQLFFAPLEIVFGTYQGIFINYFFHFKYFFGYTQIPLNLVVPSIAIVITCALILLYMRKHKPEISLQHYGKTFSNKFIVKLTFWILALFFFSATIYYWRIDWKDLNFRVMEWPPWYMVSMYYGFYPMLIIGFMPSLLGKSYRRGILIILSWIASIVILTSLSALFPTFFTPMVWSRRFLSFAFYPLVALTSVVFSEVSSRPFNLKFHLNLQLKSRIKTLTIPNLTRLVSFILTLLISLSFLSCAYTAELFYTGALTQKNVFDQEAEAYQWIYNNTPRNATILTISDLSRERLQSIACRSSFGYAETQSSWPLQVLFNARLPEGTLQSLKQLGVSYIFITPRDRLYLTKYLKDTYLNSLLNILPVVYKKGDIAIYAFPDYRIYKEANYVLVAPLLDFQNMTKAQANLEFSDDFARAHLDDWIITSGDWEIVNGELHGLGTSTVNYWGRILLNKPFTNFIYEYKAKSMQKTDPKYIWGIFRYVDEDNFYLFYIENTTFQIGEKVAGKYNVLAGGRLETLDIAKWHSIRVEAIYSMIKLYVNDKLITTVQGAGLEGKVGFLTYAGYHTVYDEVKVYSLRLPVDVAFALKNYQFTFNMLLASRINFTIVSDIGLVALEPGKVYIFPFNQRLPENIASALHEYISEGAHVLFINPLFGSYNELYEEKVPVLQSIAGLKMGPSIDCSGISFNTEHIDLNGTYLVSRIITGETSGVNVSASFERNGQPQTAYIVYRYIRNGTIVYIHLTDIIKNEAARFPYNILFERSISEILKILPRPVVGDESSLQLFPSALYKFLRINDIPALISLEDIYGYIYVYGSPIGANGLIRIQSNYTLMTNNQIKIAKLEFSNMDRHFLLENEDILLMNIRGFVELSMETASFSVCSPYYGGEIVTFLVSGNTTLYIKLIDAELSFRRSQSGEEITLSEGKVRITISSPQEDDFKIALRQPLIEVDGNLTLTSWQGIFWYKDKAVVSFRIHSSVIEGDFSIQPLFAFGGILIKVANASYIQSLRWY
ncbi:MAG: hypothetical protein KIH09_15205 [Candidatus Freyarchaeota archaeon]|nr:hypothetical protein [Candidatus Jordarchaeia archaeon]